MGLDQRLSLFPVLVQDSCPLEVAWDWTSDSPCSLSWSRIRVLWRLHGTGPATFPVPCPGPGFVSSGGFMGLDQRLSLIPSVHLCTDTNLEWMEYICNLLLSLCLSLFIIKCKTLGGIHMQAFTPCIVSH